MHPILKQMMKITNTENERQRRLGAVAQQKHVNLHSTQLDVAAAQDSSAKKDVSDKKAQGRCTPTIN